MTKIEGLAQSDLLKATDAEIEEISTRIVAAVEKATGGALRG